jgi:hypothetical protein
MDLPQSGLPLRFIRPLNSPRVLILLRQTRLVNGNFLRTICGFERSYALEGSQGEHRPETIRTLLGKLVPRIRT